MQARHHPGRVAPPPADATERCDENHETCRNLPGRLSRSRADAAADSRTAAPPAGPVAAAGRT
jgi:hypothetical protein